MRQARQSVATFETSYEFTPHNARTSAIHTTTVRQHLQNGLDAKWNHEGMPFKKERTLLLPNLVRKLQCQINKLFKK